MVAVVSDNRGNESSRRVAANNEGQTNGPAGVEPSSTTKKQGEPNTRPEVSRVDAVAKGTAGPSRLVQAALEHGMNPDNGVGAGTRHHSGNQAVNAATNNLGMGAGNGGASQVPPVPGGAQGGPGGRGKPYYVTGIKLTANVIQGINIAAIGLGIWGALAAGSAVVLPALVIGSALYLVNHYARRSTGHLLSRELENRLSNVLRQTTTEETYVQLLKLAGSMKELGIIPMYQSGVDFNDAVNAATNVKGKGKFKEYHATRVNIFGYRPGKLDDTQITQAFGRAVWELLAEMEKDKFSIPTKPKQQGSRVPEPYSDRDFSPSEDPKNSNLYRIFQERKMQLGRHFTVFNDKLTLSEAINRKTWGLMPPYLIGAKKK